MCRNKCPRLSIMKEPSRRGSNAQANFGLGKNEKKFADISWISRDVQVGALSLDPVKLINTDLHFA